MRHYSSTAISAHCHSKFRPVVIAHNYQVVCHCEAFAKRCGNLYPFVPPLRKGRWLGYAETEGLPPIL